MSRDLAAVAIRYSRNLVEGETLLYSQGSRLVLVAWQGRPVVLAERKVSSSGLANRVHARHSEVLRVFPHLDPVRALDTAIEYTCAAWRTANRRMGRRVR